MAGAPIVALQATAMITARSFAHKPVRFRDMLFPTIKSPR